MNFGSNSIDFENFKIKLEQILTSKGYLPNEDLTSFINGDTEIKLVDQRHEGVEIWIGLLDHYPKISIGFILEIYLTDNTKIFERFLNSDMLIIDYYRAFLKEYVSLIHKRMPKLIDDYYQWAKKNQELIDRTTNRLRFVRAKYEKKPYK